MTSIAYSPVSIQASASSAPLLPSWFGEMTLIAHHLQRQGALAAIEEQVRFARRRFGRYEVIDFVAVLAGLCHQRRTHARGLLRAAAALGFCFHGTLRARPPAMAFEALRTLFLHDLLARSLLKEEQPGGLWDRQRNHFLVFDVDGTREAGRQRALPTAADRPAPSRRLRPLCAPGYSGRKRGEVVRTRTTVLQTHTHQWLATFGNPGNGEYRAEVRRAVAAIRDYLKAHHHPEERALLRLDGQYGTGAVLADVAGLAYVMRGKDYQILKRAEIQVRLKLPPDQHLQHAESGTCRALYDCPALPLGPNQESCRVVIATHSAPAGKSRVGMTRSGVNYELCLTRLPQDAFTAADVVALYLHRGAFENALADEDLEQDEGLVGVVILLAVRRHGKSSANGCGTCAWNWAINFILIPCAPPSLLPLSLFGLKKRPTCLLPPRGSDRQSWLCAGRAGRFSGRDFALQPDGTLRCPAGKALVAHERRKEADGSLRIMYTGSHLSCRPCPLREQCQWHGRTATKPRRVSVLLHPLVVGSAPLLWRDWSRRHHRRVCMQLLRKQRVEIQTESGSSATPALTPAPLSRAQRAHYRLSWAERLARNARSPTAGRVTIRLFGVPEDFATSFGWATASHSNQPQCSLFSDKHASPSGVPWPLFLVVFFFCPFYSLSLCFCHLS